jgi:multidrug resistance efflux pump
MTTLPGPPDTLAEAAARLTSARRIREVFRHSVEQAEAALRGARSALKRAEDDYAYAQSELLRIAEGAESYPVEATEA